MVMKDFVQVALAAAGCLTIAWTGGHLIGRVYVWYMDHRELRHLGRVERLRKAIQ
jgi:hypothetical protein